MDEIGPSFTERPAIRAGDLYSNFDHELDNSVVYRLQDGDCYGMHYGWEFCGSVWFVPEARKWVEAVDRYHITVDIFTGDTVEEVIQKTIEEYGGN
jgi:hypothetical protein